MYSLWRAGRKLGDIIAQKPDRGGDPAVIGGMLALTAALHDVTPMMQVTHPEMAPVQHPMKPVMLDPQTRKIPGPDWLGVPSQEEAIDVEDVVDVPPERLLEVRSRDGTPIAVELIGLACWIIPATADVEEVARRWGTPGQDGRLWNVVVKFAQF